MNEPAESGAAAETAAPIVSHTPAWWDLPEEQLLDVRICDLDLRIDGTDLALRIAQLSGEMEQRGLRFRPYFWLSDDWFTPDLVTGIAIPFYLAHPRLARLEQSQMLEVEGGTPEWCMRILRHETGHAIDHAYMLHRRRRWQKLFGKSSQPYPEFYTPRPHSKSFVHHLEPWYAQSHPDEDFAETFAVWLTPDSPWRTRYAGWPALRKLSYVEALMREVGPLKPETTRRHVEPLSRLRRTLRKHYESKRERYGVSYPNVYDRQLRRLFSDEPEFAGNLKAERFLTRVRRDVRRNVARWTGEYQYTIKDILDEMINRCRELNLRLKTSEDKAKVDFTILLTVQTMNHLHSGRHRIWL